MTMESINPATGRSIQVYEEHGDEFVRHALDRATKAFQGWRKADVSHRARSVQKLAALLAKRKRKYAEIMTAEMGKPIRQSVAEIEKCILLCAFFAESSERLLAARKVPAVADESLVRHDPLGPILAVMPWNFPFWQVFRFAAPALMAGNIGVLKHASNVPGCALAIEEVFRQAGFPDHALRTLLVGGSRVDSIIEHAGVKAVTLTGSTPAGRAIARKSGEMLKKTVLELGGSDPYLILEDAELEKAASACAASRVINAGQSCIAAKRFVAVEPVRARFEALLVGEMRAKKMGDPLDEKIDIGPQARHDLRDELHRQVAESIERGARCLLGGEIPQGKGAFYPPTVLAGVRKGMPAYDEELFGPVAAIIPAKDEEDAVRIANDTVFGLGAAVFTADASRGERIAVSELEAGACFVNTFVRSDPRLPFGGVKGSGYGRELSHFGIKEFVNIKTVYVK